MSNSWRKNAIAVTGSIGSGKSTVTRMLRELGAFTIDADELARDAVRPGSAALKKIAELFGKEVLRSDGSLDRKKLGAKVFESAARRKKLEAITHPEIGKLAQSKFDVRPKDCPLVVYDCPLLFEAKLTGFKKILVVSAAEESALARVMARDGISRTEALKRLRAQLPLAEKAKRADIVVENDGTVAELRDKVKKLFRELTG